MKKLLLTLAALVLLTPASSFAITRTVDTGNPVSPTNFHTIQDAVAGATAGDTINVSPGAYTGTVVVDKALILSSSNATTTTLTGQFTVDADNVTITTFGITNPTGNFGIFVNGKSNVTLTNNSIDGVGTGVPPSPNSYGIYYQDGPANTSSISIAGNTISNVGSATSAGSNGGIGIGDSDGSSVISAVLIANNTISNITANTTPVSPGKGAYGILLNHAISPANSGSTEAAVTNNTISNLNGRWAHAIGLEGTTKNTTVTGNTISSLTATSVPANAFGIYIEDNAGVLAGAASATDFTIGTNAGVTTIFDARTGPAFAASCAFSGTPTAGPASLATTLSWFCINTTAVTLDSGAGPVAVGPTGTFADTLATPLQKTYTLAATALVGSNPTITPVTVTATGTQTITFPQPTALTYGDASATLSATSTSPTTIVFSTTTPAVCSISGTTLTIIAQGSCVVNADQPAAAPLYPAAASTVTRTVTINKKALTVSGVTVTPKVYDRTTTATLNTTGAALVGVLPADTANVTLNTAATATYNNRNAGTGKIVTVTGMSISGSAAGNYTLTQPALTGDITPRPITVTAPTISKAYNGNTNAPLGSFATVTSGNIINNTLGTDFAPNLTLGWNVAYATKDVGAGTKVVDVTPAPVNDGNGGNNYAITYVSNTTSTITPRALAVTPHGVNKVYDGTTAATLTFTDDRLGGDNLTISGTALFPNKTVQNGKVVQVLSVTKTGPDAQNYTMTVSGALVLADITPVSVTPVITAQNKVYDATTAATATCTVPTLGTDVVTCTVGAATFDTKNVGIGKTVTATGITVGGADAANYTVTTTATGTAAITAAPVTVAFTANNKVYDGTPAATILTRTVTGNIAPDPVITATGGTATFNTKDVGTGKAVAASASSFTLSDTNYTVTAVIPTTAAITKKTVTVNAPAPYTKVYDGMPAAAVPLTLSGVVGTDVVTASGTAAFTTKNVTLAPETLTISGITLGGADAGNYDLPVTTATTSGTITKKTLAVTAAGANKVFDATPAATVTLADNRVAGDVLTFTYTAAFTDAAVGTGKTVNVTAITLGGTDAGNYTANSDTMTTADITPFVQPGGGPIVNNGAGPNTSGISSGGSGGGGGSGGSFQTFTAANTNQVTNNPAVAFGGTSGQVAGVTTFKFNTNFRPGSRLSPDVTELQKILIAKGYLKIPAPTGVYGSATVAAVKKYQEANGIPVTGNVFSLTRSALNAGK